MTHRNSLIHRLLDFNLLNKWGHILLNCISSLIGKEACSMNRSNMFHIILVFIVQTVAFSEPILVERVCQDFIQISTPLSASCETSANLTQNLGNCFQSCMVYNGSSYMASSNADTRECVCCQEVPSKDVYSSGNWTTNLFGKLEMSLIFSAYLKMYNNYTINSLFSLSIYWYICKTPRRKHYSFDINFIYNCKKCSS